jgi:DNA-binding NarL/FixJ family response regulator
VRLPPVRRSLLIVDDHDGFREVARALLDGEEFEVVGEAPDGAAAVEQSCRLSPAVVLLDVHLPDHDGFEVSARLARLSPPPAVVLTSSRPIADLRRRLSSADAAGFVPKDELSVQSLAEVLAR